MSLYWLLPPLFGLGIFLLAHQILDVVADLAVGLAGLLRRRLEPAAVRRLKEFQQLSGIRSQDSAGGRRRATFLGMLQWRPFWIAAASVAAAVLWDPLYSPLAAGTIFVGGELYRSATRSKRTQRLNEDAGNLIVQFASRYPIARSVDKTLREACTTLPGGEVRSAVEGCLARLQMNQEMSQVTEPLERIGYPALTRFARLVTVVQDTNQDVFIKTLEVLKNEVEGRLSLHQQARQELTLVRGTTRSLQVVVVGAATISAVLPNWRIYFVQNAANWLLYFGMLAIVAVASLYVEAELRVLEI